MQNRKFYLLTCFLFTAAIIFPLFAQDTWKEEFTKEGISVYTRPVEGSSLNEFKGEALINASLEVCKNVIDDVEKHTVWRPDCIESKLISRNGNIAVSYTRTKAPWPVSDRDVIVKNEIDISKDKVVYNFSAINDPELIPLKEGVIRMIKVTGMWILIRKGNDTLVTYQAKIDPGGSLPAWLANSTAVDQPFKSLQGLKKMVNKPEFQVK